MTTPLDSTVADSAGFELLEPGLACEVKATLRAALKHGVVFQVGTTPLEIFRDSVRHAIGRIEQDGRAPLLLRFLQDGPYEDGGNIPDEIRGKRLTDDETAAVTGFIHSHMVNSFKGAITELLAVGPCLRLLREMQLQGSLPFEAQLCVGDTVWSPVGRTRIFAKGADMHLLVLPPVSLAGQTVGVAGVVEVKSYFKSAERLRKQLAQHLARALRGLRVAGKEYPASQIMLVGHQAQPARISVTPADWRLPRGFRFETQGERRFLRVDLPVPPKSLDQIEPLGEGHWHVTLRWSKEALDAAAYGMTFWFMEKVGEALYARGVPNEWLEMTPAEAGRNAAKMMLYYAILRSRNRRDEQRAIAIYNSYSFGCALGMNYRNQHGRREMLWPQDLDEIFANGETKTGCKIA